MIKQILILCIGLLSLTFSAGAQQHSDIKSIRRTKNSTEILVACHRGGLWQKFPENSIQAIQAAIDLGADFVEIDVRKTKDGELVLMHDKTLNRTTTGNGAVKENTLAAIKQLYLKDKNGKTTSYIVPTLKEALLLMKGKIFIKLDKYGEEDIRDEIIQNLNLTGTTGQASFRVSLNYNKLKKNYNGLLGKIHLVPAIEDTDSTTKDVEKAIKQFKTGIDPVVFQVKFSTDTAKVINYIMPLNKAGNHVWVMASRPYFCAGWDDKLSLTEPEKGWGKLIEKGVTIIETDYPEELLTYLRIKKRHQ